MTMRVKLVTMTSNAGATAMTVSSKMMTTLWPGFFLPVPSRPPRSIEIDASLLAVVGVAVSGLGMLGVLTSGRGTVGVTFCVGAAGAAPAVVIDPLSQPHSNAAIGIATMKSSWRRRRRATFGRGVLGAKFDMFSAREIG